MRATRCAKKLYIHLQTLTYIHIAYVYIATKLEVKKKNQEKLATILSIFVDIFLSQLDETKILYIFFVKGLV